MKKIIRLACMAIVAIVASVMVASCSKSDDEGNGSSKGNDSSKSDDKGNSISKRTLCVDYGFDDTTLNNYDFKFTYTDESGKPVTEDITKDKTKEAADTIKVGSNITIEKYNKWSKSIIFNKSLTSGEAYVTATRKANSNIVKDSTYTYFLSKNHYKASESYIKANWLGRPVRGDEYDKAVQDFTKSSKFTYSVSSDTLKINY